VLWRSFPTNLQTLFEITLLHSLSRVLAERVTYDEPLQLTAQLRATKGSEKQDVSSSEY